MSRVEVSNQPKLEKPKLRGYFHQEAFFIALGACVMLLSQTSTRVSFISALVFSLGLIGMLGVSSIYHRFHWAPKPRAILKRLDHSMIFILIAATTTPISIFSLSEESGRSFLTLMWSAAIVGVIQSIFFSKAPKYISALFYIAMGWMALPYLSEIRESLGQATLALLVWGGVVYTIGALFYAFKRPNFFPKSFGYHELFHVFTIIGAVMHFIVIYRVLP